MKNVSKHLFSAFVIILFIIFAIGSGGDNKIRITDDLSIEFEQVGYYKGDQQRVFTFYINATKSIDRENIPEQLWLEIEKHGKNQMHTQGKNTQSFYFLSRTQTPDITNMKTYEGAIDRASIKEPLALVYIMFNGEKGIIRNPKE